MRIGQCVAIVSLALLSVAAKADSVTGTGSEFFGSATLTATADGGGVYTITGITGTSGFGS